MSDLISRETLLKALRKEQRECEKDGEEFGGESILYAEVFGDAIDMVKNLPTVDAVEVVRCRDCKYWSGRNDKPGEVTAIGYCDHPNHHIMPLRAGWYCADGTKMDAKEDDNV